MDIIDIKPDKRLSLQMPGALRQKFTITNLTLHSVAIYLVSTHPMLLSIYPKDIILDPFQEQNIDIIGHWNESVTDKFNMKIRVYIWEIQDDEAEKHRILKQMFSQPNEEQNTLMFQEIEVVFEVNKEIIKSFVQHQKIQKYSVKNVRLVEETNETPDIIDKVISQCEKLGKVKAIYTYPQELLIQYVGLKDILCCFIEFKDLAGEVLLYSVTKITEMGMVTSVPNIIHLEKPISKIQSIQKEQQPSLENEKISSDLSKQEQKTTPVNLLTSKLNLKKDHAKKSFFSADVSHNRKRRNRSEEKIPMYEQGSQFDYPATQIDVNALKELRYGGDYEIKLPNKQYIEKSIELTKPIFSLQLSADEKQLFVLLKECLIILQGSYYSEKTIIKFDGLDEDSIKQQIPTLIHRNFFIFGSECYLYWINYRQKSTHWSYVQRKSIYAIAVLDQLGLLVVGGKNHSKLSYFGKSTTRTNIKFYSCNDSDKHAHLSTFDIPNCENSTIQVLQPLVTKPTNTKVLCVLTSSQCLYFLRVKSHQQIQTYAQIELFDIGISRICSLKSWRNHLICLEELDQGVYCFKYLKTKCSYGKIDILTQSIKLPYGNYRRNFTLGGEGQGHLIALQKFPDMFSVHCFDLQNKEIKILKQSESIKKCFKVGENQIYQENTGLTFRFIKST